MQRESVPGDEHGRREMAGIQVERRAAVFVSRGRSPHPVRNQYEHVNTGSSALVRPHEQKDHAG